MPRNVARLVVVLREPVSREPSLRLASCACLERVIEPRAPEHDVEAPRARRRRSLRSARRPLRVLALGATQALRRLRRSAEEPQLAAAVAKVPAVGHVETLTVPTLKVVTPTFVSAYGASHVTVPTIGNVEASSS